MLLRSVCIAVLLAVASPAVSQMSQLSPPRHEYAKHVYASLLKAVRYPSAARPDRLEGRAVVLFTVTSDGRIDSRRILESSGHAMLDAAALEAVDRMEPLPPFPPDLEKEAASLSFKFPLNFRSEKPPS
jgi:protein TonB